MAEVLVNTVTAILNMANGLDHTVTTVTVDDGTVFPSADSFRVAIDDEIIYVNSRTGNDLTVVRGQENTPAMAHIDGSEVVSVLTAGALAAVYGGGGGGSSPPPSSISVKEFFVKSGAAYVFQAANPFNGYQSPAANGDIHGVSVWLTPGTYELHVVRFLESNLGIVQMSVDGTNVGAAYDCYQAVGTSTNLVDVGAFVVASEKIVDILATISGKNVASSDYYCIEFLWRLVKTA